jgi:hypothetical protein
VKTALTVAVFVLQRESMQAVRMVTDLMAHWLGSLLFFSLIQKIGA